MIKLRFMVGAAFRFIFSRFVKMLPAPRVIYDREGGSPYLSRWYLLGARRDNEGQVLRHSWLERLPFNIFIHQFHRSDFAGDLHSHPWAWSFSIVLAGGYSEERKAGRAVVRRNVWPLSFNWINGDDYHRVDLLERDAWTIFVAGPRAGSWYFWNRDTNTRAYWRDYIAALRGGVDANWEDA